MANILNGFQIQKQEGINWCWIAVALSVQSFIERGPSRLAQWQVARAFNPSVSDGCCQSVSSCQDCDKQGSLDAALSMQEIDHYHDRVDEALPFDSIEQLISRGFPVPCCLRVGDGIRVTNHFVVIGGVNFSGGAQELLIYDPRPGIETKYFSYRNLVSSPGKEWISTYLVK